jgi:hypothetical protein
MPVAVIIAQRALCVYKNIDHHPANGLDERLQIKAQRVRKVPAMRRFHQNAAGAPRCQSAPKISVFRVHTGAVLAQ